MRQRWMPACFTRAGLTVTAGLFNTITGMAMANCPALMRANNNAIWNGSYYPMVKQFYADIEAFLVGGRWMLNRRHHYASYPAVRIRDGDGPIQSRSERRVRSRHR